MRPGFNHGDYVVTYRGRSNRYQVGDVVVVRHPRLGVLLKRIEATTQQHIWLQGDNPESLSAAQLGWVAYAHILGKVIWHIAAKQPHS